MSSWGWTRRTSIRSRKRPGLSRSTKVAGTSSTVSACLLPEVPLYSGTDHVLSDCRHLSRERLPLPLLRDPIRPHPLPPRTRHPRVHALPPTLLPPPPSRFILQFDPHSDCACRSPRRVLPRGVLPACQGRRVCVWAGRAGQLGVGGVGGHRWSDDGRRGKDGVEEGVSRGGSGGGVTLPASLRESDSSVVKVEC